MTENEDRFTQRTRETLIRALLELVETRHYDQISVQDIVKRGERGPLDLLCPLPEQGRPADGRIRAPVGWTRPAD